MASVKNFPGQVIKDTDQYKITDWKVLERLVVSKTILHPRKKTRGHKHPGVEEVYHFIAGEGRLLIDSHFHDVEPGSIFTIPDGAFHRVFNNSLTEDLVFICVFETYERKT